MEYSSAGVPERSIAMQGQDFNSRPDLIVRDLGRMAYGPALVLQRQLQQEVIGWRETRHTSQTPAPLGYLLLVEHDPPVITISRRPGATKHLIATPQQRAAAGVEVVETDRGGDITYHGRGQLVVYPILDLNRMGLRLHGYMRLLEQVVMDTLTEFGIQGCRDHDATGVWVPQRGLKRAGPSSAPVAHVMNSLPPAKICALGVRISRWVSMHGLALNVSTNLDHFNLIVPCGLAGRSVTSMRQLLGARCPEMSNVKAALIDRFTLAAQSAVNCVCTERLRFEPCGDVDRPTPDD